MAGLLWIVAGVVQLCAVSAYYITGFGVAFCVLQLFVILSLGLTIYQIRERGGREHSHF
jgi:hypothetical protein